MVKNHQKRITAPKSWKINRKANVFITKPNPGSHSLAFGIPFVALVRDQLHFAKTMKEVRDIIHNQTVLLDGKKVRDHKQIVGLMDVVTLNKKHFRIVLTPLGKLVPLEISESESKSKVSKIKGKSSVKKQIQINLFDGKNVLVDKAPQKVGDSVIFDFTSNKIGDTLSFSKGACILLTGGKHIGVIGTVEEIKENVLIFKNEAGIVFETTKKHAYVVGNDGPSMKIR